MAYQYLTQYNGTAFTRGRPAPPKEIVIHHWGDDSSTWEGSIGHHTRANATTSAHYFVDTGRVACVVDPDDTAWHAGNWPVNQRSIGIENHPLWTPERERTLVELCADLHEKYGSMVYSVHQNWQQTACPGRWAARVPHIMRAVNAELARRKGLPPKTSPSTDAKPITKENDPNGPRWVVEAGDTLGKIAKYYGIPQDVGRIAAHNKITDPNRIKVGQVVYIPGPLVWIVEPGDTWEKIDRYYGYAAGAIKSRNPGAALKPGTVLKVWG